MKTSVKDRLEKAKVATRIGLRRLLKRTPPQREAGWVSFAERAPEWTKGDTRSVVDQYNATDDSTSQVYVWSLATLFDKTPASDRANIYWRPIAPNANDQRHFDYFCRSQRVLG